MKLSDYVAEFLAKRGVKTIFLLPGGACMHLTDSIGARADLNYVCCLHEQGCAFAAEAYAEFANQLGVTLVTAGPGGTNTLTGVACAWIESAPVLFISGQAKRADLISSRRMPVRSMGQQEVDIIAMVRPITKYAVRIMDPRTIRQHLEQAVWTATHGRPGPVWLDIPLDVQAMQVEPEAMEGFCAPPPEARDLRPVVEVVMASLKTAKRPVLYIGNGVRAAGAVAACRELIERLNVPVLTTWKAADLLPDDHPCYIGRPGAIGQRAANFTQQKADWLLVLGARLDLPSLAFNHAGFAPHAHKIVVDVDEAELAKFDPPPQHLIRADLADFLPTLLTAVAGRVEAGVTVAGRAEAGVTVAGVADAGSHAIAPSWLALCRSWVERFPVIQPHHHQTDDYISTYALMDILSDLAQPDDVLVPGSSGPCSDIFYQAFRVREGQRILNAPGLGAMGTGLPGTIGACLASGGRRVINVNGDGGFQLNIQELETVRRLNLPIKYIILDNDGYRSIVAMQRNHFEGRLVGSDPSSQLTLPDIIRVAGAYGIPAVRVDSLQSLPVALAQTLAAPGPCVLVVKTSKDEKTEPRVTSEIRSDGAIVSKPMEVMAPLLHWDEFHAAMEMDAFEGQIIESTP